MVIIPDTGFPLTGDVRLTAGAVGRSVAGRALETVTVTAAEFVRRPAALRATAVRLCKPLAVVLVSHETVYGATVTSAPSAAP
jgi:hypothetical protein